MNDTATRGEYVAGLRALADMLEQHGDCPLPYGAGTENWTKSVMLTFYCHGRDEFDAFRRAFPGRLDKKVDEQSEAYGFELHGSLRGLHLYAAVDRGKVCRRVVTGTREVEVPETAAVEAQPARTVVVEDVEWVCEPLLAEVPA
jgi:hypothetical protein